MKSKICYNTPMKISIIIISALIVFSSCFGRTLDECNKELAELQKEKTELQQKHIYRYARRDSKRSNYSTHGKITEVNIEYVEINNNAYKSMLEHNKWLELKQKVEKSMKEQKRLQEIIARIKQINEEKYQISKEKYLKKKQYTLLQKIRKYDIILVFSGNEV